jgi:glycosyltransferase involved in cell wall biosynthesis
MAAKMSKQPLVTVGMPVRNGGESFGAALGSILGQSYRNLQVVVSDNGSDDQTAAIAKKYCAQDERVVYVRQLTPLKAFENFRFVLDQAQGEFFMWAAHDDLHSDNYIEMLVSSLTDDPTAILAFGDLFITAPGDEGGTLRPYDFSTHGLDWAMRMRKAAFTQCFHIYGVWRTRELKSIEFPCNAWWPDLPIMIAAARLGQFTYIAGPRFYYYEVPKSNLQRVQYQDYKATFSLVGGVFGLIRAAYIAAAVSGLVAGLFGAWLVIEKQVRDLPVFFGRRITRLFGQQ